ncbi:MAG: hypothetical protein HAW59_00135 [Betaproteobacteria bacterium]|nr:hypothetical protein [Betaproteobacteria bacterium]
MEWIMGQLYIIKKHKSTLFHKKTVIIKIKPNLLKFTEISGIYKNSENRGFGKSARRPILPPAAKRCTVFAKFRPAPSIAAQISRFSIPAKAGIPSRVGGKRDFRFRKNGKAGEARKAGEANLPVAAKEFPKSPPPAFAGGGNIWRFLADGETARNLLKFPH